MPDTLSAASLNDRFAISGVLSFERGEGGLTRAVITTPTAGAHVYLHGAHVTHYQPAGRRPVLFMSGKSNFAAGKAIRGGVPICFPWFGPKKDDPNAAAHGFARLREWSVQAAEQTNAGVVRLTLGLKSDDATRVLWPFDFSARYVVEVGQHLGVSLGVENSGAQPFTYQAALHTYLAVADVRRASIAGLAGVTYIDKTQNMKSETEGPDPIRIVAETDRVYVNTQSECVATDPAGGRRITVAKKGSDATVVWNPWVAKAKAMADFGDDEWPGMLCIETCNVDPCAVTLKPGEFHQTSASISAEAS